MVDLYIHEDRSEMVDLKHALDMSGFENGWFNLQSIHLKIIQTWRGRGPQQLPSGQGSSRTRLDRRLVTGTCFGGQEIHGLSYYGLFGHEP